MLANGRWDLIRLKYERFILMDILLYCCIHTQSSPEKGTSIIGDLLHYDIRGGGVVETLRYKPKGRGFDSRWGQRLDPSSRIMALGSTRALTEMSTSGYLLGVKQADE
jgi:hypothetical protein